MLIIERIISEVDESKRSRREVFFKRALKIVELGFKREAPFFDFNEGNPIGQVVKAFKSLD